MAGMSRRRARRSPARPPSCTASCATELVKFRGHVARALDHLSRLGQREPRAADTDPNDDNELALAAMRRKRELAVMERQIEAQDESFAKLYPSPPRSFKRF